MKTIVRMLGCAALLIASHGLALAETSTLVTPGGWAICTYLPYLCVGHTTDNGSEEWIVVVSSDAPADVIAFNLDIVGADGVTRSFLIRRNSENPASTMASVKFGKIPIRNVSTTLLHAGITVAQ